MRPFVIAYLYTPRTRDGIRLLSSRASPAFRTVASPRKRARTDLLGAYARPVAAHFIAPSYLFSNKFVRALMYYEKHVFSDNSVLTRETPREDSFSSDSSRLRTSRGWKMINAH